MRRFLFVCGGTAGHINPALAIAGELEKILPDSEFVFVGSGRTMEKKLIPAAGYELKNIHISGFARGIKPKQIAANFKMVKNLSVAAKESKKIIEEFKPDAVIGTGGYVCYPVLKQASKMGIPTIMHESNAVPGLSAKMLSDKVDKMLVAFPGTEKQYKRPERVVVVGTPVRSDFAVMTKEEAKETLKIGDKPLAVSFWGSLGASDMNEIMADFIKLNNDMGAFAHIHATGGGDEGLERMKERLEKRGVTKLDERIDIRPYINNMGTVMTAADIVLCRAGASTIAELTMMGKPCVLVPSPYVTNNHQEKNARAVEQAGGAKVILEKDCDGAVLFSTVHKLLNNEEQLEQMSIASKKLGNPRAGSMIADIILSMIN